MTSFCTDQGLVSKIITNIYKQIVPEYNTHLIQEGAANMDSDAIAKTDARAISIGEYFTTPENTGDILAEIQKEYNKHLNEYTSNYRALSTVPENEKDEIYEKIKKSNQDMIDISQKLYDEITKTQNRLRNKITQTNENKMKMKKTNLQENNIEDIQPNINKNVDNSLQVQYAYSRYIFWMVITCILICCSIVAALNIRLPGMNGKFKYIYLVGLLFLIWFLLSTIWIKFQQNLNSL